MTHHSDFWLFPRQWGPPHSQNSPNSQLGARQQLCEVTAPSAGLCRNQQAPKLPDDWWTLPVPSHCCLLTEHQPCRCIKTVCSGEVVDKKKKIWQSFSLKLSCLCFYAHIHNFLMDFFLAKLSASLSPQAFPSKNQTACRLIFLFIVHKHFCRIVEKSLAKIRNEAFECSCDWSRKTIWTFANARHERKPRRRVQTAQKWKESSTSHKCKIIYKVY